jgi:glyoxylase-like metal-dependent hydrolase (beta-lactamase superfamily II)
MICKTFAVGPFLSNCFILGCEKTKEAIVIDPGDKTPQIARTIHKEDLKIKYILLTHGHLDHVAGVGDLKRSFGGVIGLHQEDLELYESLPKQAASWGLQAEKPPPVEKLLEEKEKLIFGSYTLEVIHTPGHSPGGVCFKLIEKGTKPIIFCGDTLFRGSIGRTDLWKGSYQTLISSIKEKLLKLPQNTIVYPGHGPSTTIGEEARENPFLQ